jgi:hypothetical protein
MSQGIIPARAQHPQGPKGPPATYRGGPLYRCPVTRLRADPEPCSPMTLQGPVGALSLTLLVTGGWISSSSGPRGATVVTVVLLVVVAAVIPCWISRLALGLTSHDHIRYRLSDVERNPDSACSRVATALASTRFVGRRLDSSPGRQPRPVAPYQSALL